MTNIAIFTKAAAKHVLFNGNDKVNNYLATFTRQTILPMVDENYDSMSITDASMIIRAVHVVQKFPNPQLANKILNCQVDVLDRASNMELFGLIDIALEVNLNATDVALD